MKAPEVSRPVDTTGGEVPLLGDPESGWGLSFGVLLASPLAVVGGLVLVSVILAVALAPYLHTQSPDAVHVTAQFARVSSAHWLGTDWLGRDEWSRLLYGGVTSLSEAALVVVVAGALGTVVGLLAGYVGGLVDLVLMRITDAVLALPSLLVALAIAGVLGPGLQNVLVAFMGLWWAGYARLVRAQVLVVRERPYVEASRSFGASRSRIMLRHVLPFVAGPTCVLLTLDFGAVLLGISALSFLGLGAQPPAPEWGSMLNEAEQYQAVAPLLVVYPGAAIAIVVLAVNLLGDALRDALDPRTRSRVSRVGPPSPRRYHGPRPYGRPSRA